MNHVAYKEASVLLIDDDDIDVMGVKRAFKKARIANPIVRAKDGVEGLEILHQLVNDKRPYIILLDLNMPRMSGIELLSQIRTNRKTTESVVFILTTSKNDQDKTEAYKEHIAGYIVKSELDTDFSQLVQLLDHYWRIVELPELSG